MQDTICLNLFCSLLDFWWYFSSLMCCIYKNISPRSWLENLLNIGIRYIDKFILPSFHSYPGQVDHCAVILQFVIPVILFEPLIFSQALRVISVFNRNCQWFHECLSASHSVLQFCFSVFVCCSFSFFPWEYLVLRCYCILASHCVSGLKLIYDYPFNIVLKSLWQKFKNLSLTR